MELGFSCLLESLQFILLKRSHLFRFVDYGECFPVIFPIYISQREKIEILFLMAKANREPGLRRVVLSDLKGTVAATAIVNWSAEGNSERVVAKWHLRSVVPWARFLVPNISVV